jgi:protein gp37
MGLSTYKWEPDEVHLHETMLSRPCEWRTPRMVFTNSMSDFFHEKIPFQFLDRVMQVIRDTPQHVYQVLTKRSWRMEQYGQQLGEFPDNMWCGVSLESAAYKFRIEHLRKLRVETRFLSIEPILGSLGELDLSGIDWVIVGGESGPEHRPCQVEWIREVRDQCLDAGVAFFFKQWGGARPTSNGRVLDGMEWNEFPKRLAPMILAR